MFFKFAPAAANASAVATTESLTDAHRLAGELEDELRQRMEDLADVVVHTEP